MSTKSTSKLGVKTAKVEGVSFQWQIKGTQKRFTDESKLQLSTAFTRLAEKKQRQRFIDKVAKACNMPVNVVMANVKRWGKELSVNEIDALLDGVPTSKTEVADELEKALETDILTIPNTDKKPTKPAVKVAKPAPKSAPKSEQSDLEKALDIAEKPRTKRGRKLGSKNKVKTPVPAPTVANVASELNATAKASLNELIIQNKTAIQSHQSTIDALQTAYDKL